MVTGPSTPTLRRLDFAVFDATGALLVRIPASLRWRVRGLTALLAYY
jgi:hypothetical protein